ncbi:MAG: hypothetical protein R6X33_08655 [Candidatus Brocadiia bacterium]
MMLPPGRALTTAKRWAGRLWRGFNQWRRKYWLTRVIVLLIIFAPTVGPYLAGHMAIVELVRIACDAILLASAPRHEWTLARFYKAKEVGRLQMNLRTALDANRDGAIRGPEEERAREVGLDPEELRKPVIRGDLDQLARAARRLNIVPSSYSADDVRVRARDAALSASERFFGPTRHEIETTLDKAYEWPDYTKWPTWKRGISSFFATIFGLFGRPLAALTWFLTCFLGAGGASLLFRKHRPLVGFVVGAGLFFVPILAVLRVPYLLGFSSVQWAYVMPILVGYSLLTATVGYAGGRAAAPVEQRARVAIGAGALLGIVLIAGGVLSLLRSLRSLHWARSWVAEPSSGLKLLSIGPPIAMLVLGALLLVITVTAFVLRRRKERWWQREVEIAQQRGKEQDEEP